MFDVTPSELATIALVAILIFGPKGVPEFFRRAGQMYSRLQSGADELISGIKAEVEEVRAPLEEVRRDLTEMAEEIKSDVTAELEAAKKPVEEATKAAQDAAQDLRSTLERPGAPDSRASSTEASPPDGAGQQE